MKIRTAAAVLLLSPVALQAQTTAPAAPPPAPSYGLSIGNEATKKALAAAEAEAKKNNWAVAIAVVDTMTGIHAVAAINAALYARTSTGKGQHIDLALYDTALASLGNMGSYYLIGGDQPKRAGNSHFASAPNGSFETSNGKIYMAVANQKLFTDTCKAMGHPEWVTDPRFSTIAARVANKPLLTSMMEEVLKTDTKENWTQKFRHLPAGPIRTMKEALDEPEVKRRGMLKTYRHTRVGDVPLIGSNYHFSDTPVDDTRPPPSLGEHTESVLKDLAGLSVDEINALREKKVVG
jgi:crotonobetainyl-CoA:carnitine CoA-transferase CaiB-like acyl-CoA transferase